MDQLMKRPMERNPEIEFRRMNADYSGMSLTEMPFCEMEDFAGKVQTYKLDIIMPAGIQAKPLPVVFFIHGGGFVPPCDKRQIYIPMIARHLTQAGYAVVSPDYPLFDDVEQRRTAGDAAGGNKAAEAVHKAYGYINENAAKFGLDAERIAIMGGSAGGMTGFLTIAQFKDPYKAFINLWGAPKMETPDLKDFPPTLSVHGTDDKAVPYALEAPIQQSFEDYGIWHQLVTLEGAGHTPLHRLDEYLPQILDLLAKRL